MDRPLPRVASPESVGIDAGRVARLVACLEGFVACGSLPSGQLALAREGQLVATATFGEVRCGDRRVGARDDTLYSAFSTTKAIVSSAVWLLFQDG
jgi:CubicO group peptidase (beta-lactamase class C family)